MNEPQGGKIHRLTGYIMVGLASFLFGVNGNLSTLLFRENVSPVTLVEFRMIIGGLCLLLVLLVGKREALKLPRRSWPWIIAFGLSVALVTYTYFVAIKYLPLAVALIIQFSSVAWMALASAIWRRKLPSPQVMMALLLTFGGIVLITGIWHLSLNGLSSIGLLFAVLALLTYIAYLALGRRLGRDLPSMTSTTYGALVAALFWLFVQPPWQIPAAAWTPQHLPLIVLVGTLGMAIPFSLMLGALRRIDATRVGIVGMFELVAGGIIAYFWLGQRLDLWQIGGCVCVLIGITVLQYEQPTEGGPA